MIKTLGLDKRRASSWRNAGSFLATTLLSVTVGTSGAYADDLLIRNAQLIDGTGSAPVDGMSILMIDGVVSKIAPTIEAPAGITVIDAAGKTVIPGLIDSHVHVNSVPGSAYRSDDLAFKKEQRKTHLRAYLANGITSVLDTGISFDALSEVRGLLAGGAAGPNLYTLGPPLAAPGGYSDEIPESFAMGYTVPDVNAAATKVAELAAADVVGIKVQIEEGFAIESVWPIHTQEVRDALVNAAESHDLPVYVHGFSEKEQQIALDMNPHALVHGGFTFLPPSDGFVSRLKSAGTWVISTMSVTDSHRVVKHPEVMEQSHVKRSVPENQLATAADINAQKALVKEMGQISSSATIPDFLLELMFYVFPSLRAFPTEPAVAAIGKFHEAGVPIVMGSDSGNWESIPYEFHGPTSIREIELLVNAGMTPAEALAASTRLPAEMIGVADQIGTIELGKRADLVILDENPLLDIRALTSPAWVVKDGEARTPAGWMAD